jgi:hypothetical protein
MPYQIRPYNTGFRVYSESNTPLSKKALSRTRAEKQRIAATLSSIRRGDIKK